MKINIYSNQNFTANPKKLIPLSEFKGPILKLTKEEAESIKSMEEEIGKLILEKDSILSYLSRAKNSSVALFHKFSTQEHIIDTRIKFLREKIREIKINRITIQRNQK